MFFDTPSIPVILGIAVLLLVFDVLAVILRFITQHKLRQKPQVDDWLTIPSLLGVIGLSSIIFFGLSTSTLGHRWQTVDPEGGTLITTVHVCTPGPS